MEEDTPLTVSNFFDSKSTFIITERKNILLKNNYSGEPFDFEEIDSIPVSTWTNAVFQKVTKPSTGEIFFMIQEQSSSSASRQYRKQGLMIPVESLRSFLPVLLKSISIFTPVPSSKYFQSPGEYR